MLGSGELGGTHILSCGGGGGLGAKKRYPTPKYLTWVLIQTSKLTITMHSNVRSPYLPIYGNKVIACRFCQLEMHGVKRQPTWTSLDKTADVASDKITLKEKVDWKAGESIVIASTSFNGRDAEKRTIKSIEDFI